MVSNPIPVSSPRLLDAGVTGCAHIEVCGEISQRGRGTPALCACTALSVHEHAGKASQGTFNL